MGLDVIAYRQLTEAKGNEAFDETGELRDGWFQVNVNSDFPQRADALMDQHAYKYAESHHFRAGSYSGYNFWRDKLAEMAGYPQSSYEQYGKEWPSYAATVWQNPKPGPFMELINFSDCEGIIGPDTSAKIAKDFAEFQSKADAHTDDHFRRLYAEWRKAFEMAADGGAVEFC